MEKKGVHTQIINCILDYCESNWGINAKKTLLKISRVNIEELEGVQNYTDQEVFYKLLDTIRYDFNQEKKITEIGEFCSQNIINNSAYLHPILSQGNPFKFLKESDSIFLMFFPGCGIKIVQTRSNKFNLYLGLAKYKSLSLFILGFLGVIIKSFSNKARLILKSKKEDTINNQMILTLKYLNLHRFFENAVMFSVLSFILIVIAINLYIFKTPIAYFVPIEILSFISLLTPINVYINKKKNEYNRTLIKELNALEKVILSDKETTALEILNLKASITKLNQFGNSILQENTFDSIITMISENTATLLGSEKAIFFFYDNKTDKFYSNEDFHLESQISFFADEDIIGKIGKIKKPIILNDPYSNPFFNKEIDKRQKVVTKNLIAAPLIDNQGELIGVMEVLNKIQNNYFTELDLSMLVSICNYASLSMQKYILMKTNIEDEHKRIMSASSDYFSSKYFSNLIDNKNIPSFPGKSQIISGFKNFLFAFKDKKIFRPKNIERAIKKLLNNPRIKIVKTSEYFEILDKFLLYNCLTIMLDNSIEASIINETDFYCELYFSDTIRIPSEIKEKYKISAPINEWNSRKTDLGKNFKDYLSKSYPLLDDDMILIEKSAAYSPKLIFIDTCGGIDIEIQDKIFYPFFTTKKNHHGIGLNKLKKIVTENNGIIDLKNKIGKGVEITIYFENRGD